MDSITDIITKYEAEGIVSPLFHKSQLLEDSRELLRLGFWPDERVKDADVIRCLKHGDELSIKNSTLWYYVPLEILKRDCETYPFKAYVLSARDPNSVYKSGLPKTTMSNFRTSSSMECPLSSIANGRLDVNGEQWSAMPVTRYGPRARMALYFHDIFGNRGATFYNSEPESTVFLPYKKAYHGKDKISVLHSLLVDISRCRSLKRISNESIRDRLQQKGIAHYIRDPGGLCDDEVSLHALLSDLAVMIGCDVIVLESTKEVLDTHSSEGSFASLIYTY